jgi:hypothetical protein
MTRMAFPAGTVRNMYSRGFAKFAQLKTVIQSQGYFAIGKLRLANRALFGGSSGSRATAFLHTGRT